MWKVFAADGFTRDETSYFQRRVAAQEKTLLLPHDG
jgi:hypothetical protein